MGLAGNVVRWDDIMDALRTLDREAAGSKPLPHYKRVLARKSAGPPRSKPPRREPRDGPMLN